MADHIYVANHTPEDVYIVAGESPGWALADMFFNALLPVIGEFTMTLKVIWMATHLPQKVETLYDYYLYMRMASQILEGTVELDSDAVTHAQKLVNTFMQNSMPITSNNYKDIRDTGFIDYLSPSGVAGLIGADTVYVIVMAYGGRKITAFETNIDDSWIVNESGVVRSKYGTINQEDPSAGQHSWEEPPFGSFIPQGSYINSCKSIKVMLTCQAQNDAGNYVNANFDLTLASDVDLANMNGILKNQGSAKQSGFIPAGSYKQTSEDIKVILTCQAQKIDQSWANASLDLTNVIKANLSNNNGTIVNNA